MASLAMVGHSKNSIYYNNAGTQNRLTTKVDNSELLKKRDKKGCFPYTVRKLGILQPILNNLVHREASSDCTATRI